MMKNWQDLVWQMLIGLLVIFLGGGLLGGALNLAAAASPETASLIFCPKGSIAIANPDPDQRYTNKFPILCRDQSGFSLPPLPDDQIMALQRKYFYTPSYSIASVLVIAWFLRPLVRKTMRHQKNVQTSH